MEASYFYLIGKVIQQKNPELFNFLIANVNELERSALNSIEKLPALYESYCAVIGPAPVNDNPKRCNTNVLLHRRLFIAIAVHLYDPLYINNYAGRLKDKLRNNIAHALNCCPEWISNVLPSVLFEYSRINTFQMQVNLIAYYLRKQATGQAA